MSTQAFAECFFRKLSEKKRKNLVLNELGCHGENEGKGFIRDCQRSYIH